MPSLPTEDLLWYVTGKCGSHVLSGWPWDSHILG